MRNIIKLILISSILIPISTTKASGMNLCEKNPIYCQIVRNHPEINKSYAMDLSKLIIKLSKRYKVDAKLLTAILAQESRYNVAKKNCNARFCTDFGIAQINWRTADVYGFDRDLLTSDIEYSLNAGVLVLAEIKARYAHKEVDYWTRYNASTPSKRQEYKLLVTRYL